MGRRIESSHPGHHTSQLGSILIGAFLSFAPLYVGAGEWSFDPRIGVNEIYSDNISLDPEGQEEEEFVTELSPAIRIRGDGARLDLNLDFVWQGLYSARQTSPFRKNQTLQTDATTELWEQIFFIDARATMREENVNSTDRASSDNISQTGNQTTITTMAISPYFRHHFGTFADLEARLNLDEVSTGGVTEDSTAEERRISLRSGRSFSRMTWNGSFSDRTIENEGGSERTFKQLEGTVRYQINRKFGVLYTAGVDKNEFTSTQPGRDGFRWRIGGTWTPSPRTTLEVAWGKQQGGENSNFFLDFSHRARRSVWTASFRESLTTTRDRLLDREIIPLEDAFGEPIDDITLPEQQNAELPLDLERIEDRTLLVASFNAGYAYAGRRMNWNVGLFSSLRTDQEGGAEETTMGGRFLVSRALSRRTTARLSGNLLIQDQGGEAQDTRLGANASIVHQLGRNLSASLAYRFTTRSSELGTSEFDENRFTAGLQATY